MKSPHALRPLSSMRDRCQFECFFFSLFLCTILHPSVWSFKKKKKKPAKTSLQARAILFFFCCCCCAFPKQFCGPENPRLICMSPGDCAEKPLSVLFISLRTILADSCRRRAALFAKALGVFFNCVCVCVYCSCAFTLWRRQITTQRWNQQQATNTRIKTKQIQKKTSPKKRHFGFAEIERTSGGMRPAEAKKEAITHK